MSQSFEGDKLATKPAAWSLEELLVTDRPSNDRLAGLVAGLHPSKLCNTPARRREETFAPRGDAFEIIFLMRAGRMGEADYRLNSLTSRGICVATAWP